MPFLSKAQQRWGNSPAGIKALGGKKKVAEWNDVTKGRKLPARINKNMKPYKPGDMITKMNARKMKRVKKAIPKKKLSIMGLV
jgi:hypothetical protein